MVTFGLFARPIIETLAGMGVRKLAYVRATKTAIRTKPGLTRFLPVSLTGEFKKAEVELGARWQGSGDIVAVARELLRGCPAGS